MLLHELRTYASLPAGIGSKACQVYRLYFCCFSNLEYLLTYTAIELINWKHLDKYSKYLYIIALQNELTSHIKSIAIHIP
jgi:hypothetical protein